MSNSSTNTYNSFKDVLEPIFEHYKWKPFLFKEATRIFPDYSWSIHKRCIGSGVIKSVGYAKRSDTCKQYMFTSCVSSLRDRHNMPLINRW